MKNLILSLAVLFMLTGNTGCIKDTTCQNKSADSEKGEILAYAAANSITATAHSSGLYYEIITPGSGPTPTASSKVFVTYAGKRMDGTQFDAGSSPVGGWFLTGLIQGWQIGLPLIQKGGRIKLIVPSSLAYGCEGFGTIAGNSVLYFDITLNDVQ
jgi:FKBP-type peptidyl-prolyl cis-trans isomerase FkpA